jgi:hypothetical protein
MIAETILPSEGSSVPEIQSETATTNNKWRRYRLKKQQRQAWQESGEAFLHTECLFCSAPIKASFTRGFCPGGVCRKEYRNAVPVHRVVPITGMDKFVSKHFCELKMAIVL